MACFTKRALIIITTLFLLMLLAGSFGAYLALETEYTCIHHTRIFCEDLSGLQGSGK